MQYSYKKNFVESLSALKKSNSGIQQDVINLQNQPDWRMPCIVGMDKFINGYFKILLLKMSTDSEDSMFSRINFQTFAPRQAVDSLLNWTVL